MERPQSDAAGSFTAGGVGDEVSVDFPPIAVKDGDVLTFAFEWRIDQRLGRRHHRDHSGAVTMGNPVVAEPGTVVDVTLSVPAEAVDDNDVLAATQEIPNVFRRKGGAAILQSLVVLDEADQGVEMDLVFLDSDVAIGTEDAAVSITDANARQIIGVVNVATYTDFINSQVATVDDIGLMLKGDPGSSSLFIAAITRGTPTYAADSLKIKLGLRHLG